MQATKNTSQLTEKYFYNLVQTWNHMLKKTTTKGRRQNGKHRDRYRRREV